VTRFLLSVTSSMQRDSSCSGKAPRPRAWTRCIGCRAPEPRPPMACRCDGRPQEWQEVTPCIHSALDG